MRTDFQLSHLSVQPGQSARVEIDVVNTVDVDQRVAAVHNGRANVARIDGFTAIVDGINPSWVKLDRSLNLFPEASGRLGITFDIPTNCPAGDYLIIVRLVSENDPDDSKVHDFWLTVDERVALSLSLRPSIVTGGGYGHLTATVCNEGNVDATVGVSGIEPSRAVDCRVEPSVVVLPQGGDAALDVGLRGPRPWFGQAERRSITITAQSGDQIVEEVATFNQKPRIPRGLITALILTVIILLWALIFFLVMRAIQSDEEVPKQVASDRLTGTTEIPLANIAGVISGEVVSATDGDGLERITVSVWRVSKPSAISADATAEQSAPAEDGGSDDTGSDTASNERLVSSVATAEDGTFVFPALLPGSYKIVASAEGFVDSWFGAPADGDPAEAQENATVVPVTPSGHIDGDGDDGTEGEEDGTESETAEIYTLTIGGLPGTLSGTVDLPDEAAGTELTAIATLEAGEGAGETGDAGAEQPEVTSSADPDPAPDDSASPSEGAPAASGDCDQVTTFCGTVDPETGMVVFTDLPTPGEYLVTIEGTSFQTETFEVALDGGDTAVFDKVRMTAADGSVFGSVTQRNEAGALAFLGGVTVTVRSGDVEVSVVTPTSPSAPVDGVLKEFEFVGLETPATYIVTFEKEGYSTSTESLRVGPGGSGSATATLIGGIGTITGNVIDEDGAPLGGVEVTVVGEGVRTETATLTTASDDDDEGSFTVSDLPIPGAYTVTLRRDDVQTESVAAVFVDPGTQSVGTVQMSKALFELTGRVVDIESGAPLGDVDVTLSNGQRSRTTRTATFATEAGQFVFGDIPRGSYTLTFGGSAQTHVVALTVPRPEGSPPLQIAVRRSAEVL